MSASLLSFRIHAGAPLPFGFGAYLPRWNARDRQSAKFQHIKINSLNLSHGNKLSQSYIVAVIVNNSYILKEIKTRKLFEFLMFFTYSTILQSDK